MCQVMYTEILRCVCSKTASKKSRDNDVNRWKNRRRALMYIYTDHFDTFQLDGSLHFLCQYIDTLGHGGNPKLYSRGRSGGPPTIKGNHTYLEFRNSAGFHRSAMKIYEPGMPGKGTTNVLCAKKVASWNILFPPMHGFPIVSHGPMIDSAACANASFGAHPVQPDVIM